MGIIKVIKPGIFSSIQDAGRRSYGQFGIPKSGALDQNSLRLSNALVGNPAEAAVLEMTYQGAQLLFEQTAAIALAGAAIPIWLDNQQCDPNTLINVPAGGLLKIGNCQKGVRSYLAIAGGFDVKRTLGSGSWSRSLHESFRLSKGDQLSFQAASEEVKTMELPSATSLESRVFQVIPGPEFHWLSEAQRAQIFENQYRLLPRSDRMAFSMESEPILPYTERSFLTSPVIPGVVQWYPNGQLVLLQRDAQRTGGYPRILILTEAAINEISQLSIGQDFTWQIGE